MTSDDPDTTGVWRQKDGGQPGFFVWDMRKDIVFADEGVAAAFGLDPLRVQHGLEIGAFLERIHPADRGAAVKEIRQIEHEGLYRMFYRIIRPDTSCVLVRCVGFTFFDADGPVKKAGSLRPVLSEDSSQTDDAIDHCLAAYQMAAEDGQHMVQYLVGMALQELGFELARSR